MSKATLDRWFGKVRQQAQAVKAKSVQPKGIRAPQALKARRRGQRGR